MTEEDDEEGEKGVGGGGANCETAPKSPMSTRKRTRGVF